MRSVMTRRAAGVSLWFTALPTWGRLPQCRAGIIDIAPWGRTSERGQPEGVFVDVCRALGAEIADVTRLELMPLRRVIAELAAGNIDFTVMLESAELEAVAEPIGLVRSLDIIAIPRLGLSLTDRGDLRGRTVATLRGTTYDAALDLDPRVHKLAVTSPDQQLAMLRAGRIDAVVGVLDNFKYVQSTRHWDLGTFGPQLLLQRRAAMLHVRKDRAVAEFGNRLREALTKVKGSGLLDRLMTRLADMPAARNL